MDIYLGTILFFAFDYAPAGYGCTWAPCQGQLMDIRSNPALFALLGTKYGGDGIRTFGLPNLTDASPSSEMGYFIATSGLFPPRQ